MDFRLNEIHRQDLIQKKNWQESHDSNDSSIEIISMGNAQSCDIEIPDLPRDNGLRIFHSLGYVTSGRQHKILVM